MPSTYAQSLVNYGIDTAARSVQYPGSPCPLMLCVRSEETDDATLRRQMLGIHCISDLDEQARETADTAFGHRRNTNICSAENYMDVGRALCASYELEKNPYQAIISHGEELGIHMPDKWETNQDLYASIGEQFTTHQRIEYNAAKARADAAAKAKQEEAGQLAQSALAKFMTDTPETITPEEYEGLRACGISKQSLQTARAACEHYRTGKGLNQSMNSIGIVQNGPRAPYVLAAMADTIGEDKTALDLALQYIRSRTIDEERQRRSGGVVSGNYGSAQSTVQQVQNTVDEWANDVAGVPLYTLQNIGDSISNENVHWYDALGINPSLRQTRRNAFAAQVKDIRSTAVQEAMQENPHVTDALQAPVTGVADAAKWLLPGKLLKAGAAMTTLMENERSAAMREYNAHGDLSFKNYSWWDKAGTAALQTGITYGAFKLAGAVNGGIGGAAAGMWQRSASASAQQLTQQLMQSRVAGFIGHTAVSAATMEEISGLEWALNLAADHTLVNPTQRTAEAHRQAIVQGWTSADGLTEKALTAIIFGTLAAPGMVSRVQYEKWKATIGMSPEQSRRYDAAKTTEQRRDILEEMRAADPSGFRTRAAKAGEFVIAQAEMEALAKAGIEDYILKSAGITKTALPDGRYQLTKTTTDAEGKEVTETHTYTQEQLNDYYATKHESIVFRSMVELQARARGEKLAQAAERVNTPFLKIISLDKLDPELIKKTTLRDGQVTESTIRALAEKARADIAAWTERYRAEGKEEPAARAAAEQQTMGESGVPLKALSGIDNDFAERIRVSNRTGDLRTGKEAATTAFIMPRSIGEVTLALCRGEATESEVLHDLVEAHIRAEIAKSPDALAQMKETLRTVDLDLRRKIAGEKGILPLKGDLSELEIIEAMSRLATADILAHHDKMALSPETHAALETARSIMGDLQTLSALASAWKSYATSDKGRTALAENANLLRDILEKSKAYVRDIYAEAEKQSTREAADIITSYDRRKQQERQKLVDDYKASKKPLSEEERRTEPESTKHPEAVHAAESITGEAIPAETFYEAETVNQDTGEIIPPEGVKQAVSDPQGKGRGLINGTYHQGAEKHIYGAAAVRDITIPVRFTTERSRQNIDRSDPATHPVLVYRAEDGTLTAIGNLGRLELSRERGKALVDVEIIEGMTPEQAADAEMEYAMRTDCAEPPEILDYYERHHTTRAEAYENGLIPPTVSGEPAPAAQIAWRLREQGTPAILKALRDGSIDIDTALRITELAPSDTESQQYAVRLKNSPKHFRWATIEKRVRQYADKKLTESIEKAGGETNSFSVREYQERKPLEELLREERVSRLIEHSRALAKQLAPQIQLNSTDDLTVRELLGRVVAFHGALRKEFAHSPHYREAVEKDLSRAESRLRAMNDILNGKTETPNIKTLPEAEQQSAAAAEDKLKWVCNYLGKTEADLIERGARLIEEQEMDGELEELDALIDRAHPKLQKNKRTAPGAVGVEAARNAERYRRMMNLTREEVTEKLNAIEAAIQKGLSADTTDAAALSRLKDEQAELLTYGALRSRGLDALRQGCDTLRKYLATEKKAWRAVQEAQMNRVKQNIADIAAAQRHIDPGKLARQKAEGEQSRIKNIGHMFSDYENIYDLLERLTTKIPLARRWKQQLARATDALSVMINADKRNERAWIAQNLGYRTDRQMALWLERTTSVRKTGITTEGKLDTQTHTISIEEAERIIRLTPEERSAERKAAAASSDGNQNTYPTEAAVEDMKHRIEVRGYMDDKIQYMNTGDKRSEHHQSEDMELSQQQAANIVLLAEQNSYAMQMDALGYTPRVIEKLRAYAGAEVMAYAYWARGYLNATGTKKVFEERMGVPFPAEKNYWPGNFDTSSVTDNGSSFVSGAATGRGIYTVLITRSLHNFEPDLTLGANEVLRISLAAHRTYETRSAIADEMRRTIGDPDTAARLRTIMGEWDYDRFKDSISVVDGAYAADAVACRAERKIMSWNNTAKTLTWLPGRLTSIAVQITALNNARAAQGASLAKLVREIVGIRTDSGESVMTPKKILELPCFKARYYEDGLYERLTRLPQNSKFSTLSVVANTFMRMMGKSDLWSNALGMTLLYRMEYRKWKNLYPDIAEEKIRAHCESVVSETLHLAAQPIDATDKSIRYITSSDAIAQIAWLCKSDALKSLATARTIGIRDRQGEEQNTKKKLASTVLMGYDFYRYLLPGSIMAQAVRAVLSVANGNAPAPGEDGFEDWCLRNVLVALSLGGYIESIPFLGGFISYQARNFVATGTTTGNRTSFDPFGAGDALAIKDFLLLCNDICAEEDKHWDSYATLKLLNALRGAGIVAGSFLPDNQVGAAVKNGLNAVNAVGNVARDFVIRDMNDKRRAAERE